VEPTVAVLVRAVAAVLASGLVVVLGQRTGLLMTLTSRQVLLMSLAGVGASLVGNFFYFNALKDMDAGLVVAATSTYPAVTLLLSWWFFGERPQRHQLVAFALILAGLVLLNWPQASATPASGQAPAAE
jgi:uncharacterized membrane protein